MAPLNNTELKIMAELMNNSRRSDRELARALGISQPTVSRIIKKLAKEGVIKEFTITPDFMKLGYTLMSIIFIRIKNRETSEDAVRYRKAIAEDIEKEVFPDLLMKRGIGLAFEGVIVSLHRSYADYTKQVQYVKTRPFVQSDSVDSFLVDLTDPMRFRDLSFSLIAKDLIEKNRRNEEQENRREISKE